jgi:hypothetical protein
MFWIFMAVGFLVLAVFAMPLLIFIIGIMWVVIPAIWPWLLAMVGIGILKGYLDYKQT